MVDDSREEHRMIVFGNDSDPVQEHLVRDELRGVPVQGILAQKVHEQSYTVTLYAGLRNCGLMPVVRIKPRIRFRRFNYDNLSSSAPLRFGMDDIVHFAELKRGSDPVDAVDPALLERVFGDAPSLEGLSDDPAQLLVAQRDVFLRQAPFKTKTKVFGQGSDFRGIPIGNFLDALNNLNQAEMIFEAYPQGKAFARDLIEALAPYGHAELDFRLYSRYERRDCVLAEQYDAEGEGYRTTFDPWTVLGYVRPMGDTHQLQILAHERGTRWEHKIIPEGMAQETLDLVAKEIRELRRRFLIGRVLSKSQTALTVLASSQEAGLNLVQDLFPGYELEIQRPVHTNYLNDIDRRRALRRTFEGTGPYKLHRQNVDFVERHLNVARGIRQGVIYTLDGVYLQQSPPPERVNEGDVVVVRRPASHGTVLRSAADLREQLPVQGFERCWNDAVDEGGYTITSDATGRSYLVAYGRHVSGSVLDGKVHEEEPRKYVSIRYLGIGPEQHRGGLSADLARASRHKSIQQLRSLGQWLGLQKAERAVIHEMKQILAFLSARQLT